MSTGVNHRLRLGVRGGQKIERLRMQLIVGGIGCYVSQIVTSSRFLLQMRDFVDESSKVDAGSKRG